GYGLPAALGVALAYRGSGKLCVNLQADGDLLYVVSGLYTAAHHRLPFLTIMFNNRTYGNDEEHQEAVAKTRGRPVENKIVGIRIDDPAPDFARIAQGFGVHAERSKDFYCRVLGFQVLERPAFQTRGYWLGTPGIFPQIHIIQSELEPPGPGASISPRARHTCFEVADYDAMKATLEREGITYI